MSQSSEIFQDVALCVALHNCEDASVCCDVSPAFSWWCIPTQELLVHKISAFLENSYAVNKLPNVRMVNTEFSLHPYNRRCVVIGCRVTTLVVG
jgi:hypothetical protein